MHGQRPSGMKNVDRLIYAAPFKDNWTQLFNVKLLGLSQRVQSHNRFCISEFVSLSNRKTSKPSVVWLKSFLSTYPGWRVATGHTCFTAVISPFDPSSSQSCAVGETSCVCLYLCSFLSERHITTTTFRSLRYNVHSVGVNIYIQWGKSWSLSSTDHEYARRFVGIHNKRVDGSQGTAPLADTDTELQMFSWTNERSRLGNWDLCGKAEKSSFNFAEKLRGWNFLCSFQWTVRNTNSRVKEQQVS